MQLVHDRCRRLRRRDHAQPRHGFVAGQARLGDGGRVGQRLRTLRRGHGQEAHLAVLDEGARRRVGVEHHLQLAADHVGERGRAALVGDVLHLHAGHAVEELGLQVRGRARAHRAVVGLVGVGLEPAHQLAHVLRRNARMHHQHVHHRSHLRDRCEVFHRVVVDLAVQAGRDAQRRGREQQRVAVGRSLGDVLRRDHGAGAGLVLHQHGLAQALVQPLGEQARHDVGRAAGRERHDERDGLGRVGLRRGSSARQSGGGQGHAGQCFLEHGMSPVSVDGCGCVYEARTSASSARTPWPCSFTSSGLTSTSSACSCSASTARENPAMARHAASTSPSGRPR
ncbi:hypothetical protein D3C87_1299660 [compost metagenome]